MLCDHLYSYFVLQCFGFTSNKALSQHAKIRIKENKVVSVDEVFKIIKEQSSEYMFIYPQKIIRIFFQKFN